MLQRKMIWYSPPTFVECYTCMSSVEHEAVNFMYFVIQYTIPVFCKHEPIQSRNLLAQVKS